MDNLSQQEAVTPEQEFFSYVDHDRFPDLPKEGESSIQMRYDSAGKLVNTKITTRPVEFEPDCHEVIRTWMLSVMNGEPDYPKLSADLLVRAALELELLVDAAMGELNIGLERVFDAIPQKLGEKVDAIFWAIGRFEDEAKRHRERAREHQALAQSRDRTIDRLKALLTTVFRSQGEEATTKAGNMTYRIETPTGNASCYLHRDDKIVWEDGRAPKTTRRAESMSIEDGMVTVKVPEEAMPLAFGLTKASVVLEADNTAIRNRSRIGDGKLPEGSHVEPNWIVCKPVVRKRG